MLFITGKGPEKERYEKIIKERRPGWKNISIQTLWLKAEDYPKLLASADLGICLHVSSCGLCLPMKVVDMFGAGLPCFAINYTSISELVQDNINGRIFDSSKDLTKLMMNLFQGWPKNQNLLSRWADNAKKFRQKTFSDEWAEVVLPIV